MVWMDEVNVDKPMSAFFKRHRIEVLELRLAVAASLGSSEDLVR
jgi:hypothetical protein